MMRGLLRAGSDQVEEDFQRRVLPSLTYCSDVGNVYSASAYLALCGLIDHADLSDFNRIGLFSYGSGCSSEFYSGIVTSRSKKILRDMRIGENLASRYELSMDEYDEILDLSAEWTFGVRDKVVDRRSFSRPYDHFFDGRGLLVLNRVKDFHREYVWS